MRGVIDERVRTDDATGGACRTEALVRVEQQVGQLVRIARSSKAWLCRCLGTIERERLYCAAGAPTFKHYLRMRRLPIAYQTAQQYATIGRVLHEYRDFLAAIDYDEHDGLSKLRYLPRALANHPDRSEVARHVKHDSFRRFFAFANATGEGVGRPVGRRSAGRRTGVTAVFDDDTILAVGTDGSSTELMWLNAESFATRLEYQEFVRLALALASDVVTAGSWPASRRAAPPVPGRVRVRV